MSPRRPRAAGVGGARPRLGDRRRSASRRRPMAASRARARRRCAPPSRSATILRPSIVFGREDQFVNRFAGLIAEAPVVPVLRAEAQVPAGLSSATSRDGRGRGAGRPRRARRQDLRTRRAGRADDGRAHPLDRRDDRPRTRRSSSCPTSPAAADRACGFLPGAPITRDQWLMLQRDNVVAPARDGLAALGIAPTPLAAVAPAGWCASAGTAASARVAA